MCKLFVEWIKECNLVGELTMFPSNQTADGAFYFSPLIDAEEGSIF
jgi:hypothetical protein